MLFLLRQRLVLFPAIVFSLAWASLFTWMTIQMHKATLESLATMTGIAIMCGLGTTVLLVGPAFMIHRHFKAENPVFPLQDGERVLYVGVANHTFHGEARGGRLLVTDRRIGFRPHRYNVQLEPWSVPFEGVIGVRHRLPTFVLLDMLDGTTERLVVEHRKEVAAYLDALRMLPVEQREERSRALCKEHGLLTLTE
jgi:hypothetical protein